MIVETEPRGMQRKPRMVFFRATEPGRPEYILVHLREQLKCLSQFFDVVLIGETDCDYKQACESYRPEIALFESGVYTFHPQPRIIRNTDAYPEIPKLGFYNADSYCESRELFLSDMFRWGVETFFTISASTSEYTPEIADRLFDWPNFADHDVFRDYGESKLIPVLSTGSLAAHYPWRGRILKRVKNRFPTLTCPHFGWIDERATARMMSGEKYARLINASCFVPACGTIANDLVRKYFEIPAAKACLVAQRTPALEAAGFVDMQNCVFAEDTDVVEKLDHLFAHPEELERITLAGHDLVRSAHGIEHRDQLYQWFRLHQSLPAGHKIIQPGLFQPLIAVPNSLGIGNSHAPANGLDRALLRDGDEKLWSGKYPEAITLYLKCLSYHRMPEPVLRLVLAHLFAGKTEEARKWSSEQIQRILSLGAATPDPVEWAYLIVVALCQGRTGEALEYAGAFPELRHSELDRARFLAELLAGRPAHLPLPAQGPRQFSVHQLPERDLAKWMEDARKMLAACGQGRLAHAARTPEQAPSALQPAQVPQTQRRVDRESLNLGPSWSRRSVSGAVWRGRRGLVKALQAMESWTGPFLPYRISSARQDAFLVEVETLAREEAIEKIVVFGAADGDFPTEACLRGSAANRASPQIIRVTSPGPGFSRIQARHAGDPRVLCVTDPGQISSMEGAMLVALDGSEVPEDAVSQALLLVLDGINQMPMHEIHRRLAESRWHELLDHNPAWRKGYAIYRRIGRGVVDAEMRWKAPRDSRVLTGAEGL